MKPVKNQVGGRWIDRVFGPDRFPGKAFIVLGLLFSILRFEVRHLFFMCYGAYLEFFHTMHISFLKFNISRLERLNGAMLRKPGEDVLRDECSDDGRHRSDCGDGQQRERIRNHCAESAFVSPSAQVKRPEQAAR